MDSADTFDPFDTASDRDLHPAYDELRRRCPVSHLGDGLHFVARHADNKAVYRLPKVFSNKGNFVLEDESGTPYPALITQSDPPRHSDLRRLLVTAFSPSAMVEAERWVRQIVESRVEEFCTDGEVELVANFALPLTMEVVGVLVGVPAKDRLEVAGWSMEVARHIPGSWQKIPSWTNLTSYFGSLIASRRASGERPPDLMSRLMDGVVDGHPMADDEVVLHAWQLFVAGIESTAYTIVSLVNETLQRRELWEQLLNDRSLVPSAVEEALRYTTPIRWMIRTALSDHELAGTRIAVGERVVLGLESANFDPHAYSEPEEFRLDRGVDLDHLALGTGIHLCIGAPLARLEIRLAIETLLDRLPCAHIAPDYAPELVESALFRGLKRLDLVW